MITKIQVVTKLSIHIISGQAIETLLTGLRKYLLKNIVFNLLKLKKIIYKCTIHSIII